MKFNCILCDVPLKTDVSINCQCGFYYYKTNAKIIRGFLHLETIDVHSNVSLDKNIFNYNIQIRAEGSNELIFICDNPNKLKKFLKLELFI